MIKVLLSLFLCFSLLFALDSTSLKDTSGANVTSESSKSTLQLIHADSNINEFREGQLISTLYGNVEFQLDDMNIKTDTTEWRRGEGVVTLLGSVVMEKPQYGLTCHKAVLNSGSKNIQLTGDVVAVDSSREITITSDTADYYLSNDSVYLKSNPVLYFWKEGSEDTMVVHADTMLYSSNRGWAQALDSVSIVGPDVDGQADSALFWAEGDSSYFIGNARMKMEQSGVAGDSVLLYFKDQAVETFDVRGEKPLAFFVDTTSQEEFRLTSDSLSFVIDGDRIDTIYSVGNSLTEQYSQVDSTLSLRMTGGHSLYLFEDGQLARIEVTDSAYCRRFEKEDSSVFIIEGDSITFEMKDGELSSMVARGSAESLNYRDTTEQNLIKAEEIEYLLQDDDKGLLIAKESVRAVYYSDSTTMNEVAGDTLEISIVNNSVENIVVVGAVHGFVKSRSKSAEKESDDEE